MKHASKKLDFLATFRRLQTMLPGQMAMETFKSIFMAWKITVNARKMELAFPSLEKIVAIVIWETLFVDMTQLFFQIW